MYYLAGIPEVTIKSTTTKVQEGGNLTFVCEVTGVPTPSVKWNTDHLRSSYTEEVRNSGPAAEAPWSKILCIAFKNSCLMYLNRHFRAFLM